MTQPVDPTAPMDPPVDPGSDEALSAYLAGELDEQAAAAFEARLAADPALTARLDALAGALVTLAGADDVEPPQGFGERLGARLEAEGAAADLDARRRAASRRWSAVATAAAAVAVLAIAGGRLLAPAGDDAVHEVALKEESAGQAESMTAQDEFAADSAQDLSLESGAEMGSLADADADGTDGFAPAPMSGGGEGHGYGGAGDSAGGSGGGSGADSPAAASAPVSEERMAAEAGGPVIADEQASFSTDDELRAYYQGRPEAEQLRGMAREEAVETAARHADQVRAAAPFSSGVRPDACLDEVLQMDQGPRIVARAEWIRWQDGGSVAYVLAVAGPQSTAIDAFELWVVQPDGCSLRRHLSWR
jgi:hypothetical protein